MCIDKVASACQRNNNEENDHFLVSRVILLERQGKWAVKVMSLYYVIELL